MASSIAREPSVSQALVRSTAQELATLLGQVGAQEPRLLFPYRQKIVDGNGLGATDHRLEVLRDHGAGAKPREIFSRPRPLLN